MTSARTSRISIVRQQSLLDDELDLLEALRFAKGEPSRVIDATFEDDVDGVETSEVDTEHVAAVARRMAMMRDIRALSKLAGAVPMQRTTNSPPALPAPNAAVTRESFITIPPAVGSVPPPAIAGSSSARGATSPLDPTVRLPRITPAFAAAITARSEPSAGRVISAVLISAMAVAFTWWLVLDQEVTSPLGSAKTVQTSAGVSAAAQKASALAAGLGLPSVISTASSPPDPASSAPVESGEPDVITGPVHQSAIVNPAHPVYKHKSKLAPKPPKSATSALELESSAETGHFSP